MQEPAKLRAHATEVLTHTDPAMMAHCPIGRAQMVPSRSSLQRRIMDLLMFDLSHALRSAAAGANEGKDSSQ